MVEGLGRHLDAPCAVRHRVGHRGLDAAGHALGRVGLVQDGEGDRVGGEGRDVERAVRPVVGSAVQRVLPIVFLRLVRHPINRVLSIADAVGVPAGDGIVHRVTGVLGCAYCQSGGRV